MNNNQELSDCHKAPIQVASGEEGTNFYICRQCLRPCDLFVAKPHTNKQQRSKVPNTNKETTMPTKKATRQQVLNALAYYFDWSARYIRAAKQGDKALMDKLDREYDPESVVKGDHHEPTRLKFTQHPDLDKLINDNIDELFEGDHHAN